ncbi:TPA: hypothetical protein RRU48_005548 [Klebsiella pneumoniae]|uniref:hypothetical protein n=1 Tax=Klebsiella TaxID=570 RepID=UPI000D740363|nr:hypothetical protein [Klebsiella variicola]PXL35863.1 hypothetical protein DMS60_20025 [Klebsiella variicola]HBW8876203.1 hypothetical protein [Klebsiella quasipneumoniae subsp. similipneumoniae]HDZ1153696.1 hypothetical protein [Klebsiella pneumoniae]
MNYIERIKMAMKPELHKFNLVDDIDVYIHRPSISDAPKCDTLSSTLILCVKDENGDPIFSDSDIEGRINVNSIDSTLAGKIFNAIMGLLKEPEDIEKK